jgi:hypothetical protein
MIHCLATPFLITALPFFGKNFLSEKSEIYLIGASAILAIFLLIKDYQNHQNILPLILLVISLCINFIGLFLAIKTYEVFFNVAGALVMATAYWLNWNAHRRTCHSHSH